jgi:hypothetical protein
MTLPWFIYPICFFVFFLTLGWLRNRQATAAHELTPAKKQAPDHEGYVKNVH